MSFDLMNKPVTASAATEPCEEYIDHGSARPSVSEGHHDFPQYLQIRLYGKVIIQTLVYLCGNCHDNTHAWLYWLLGERARPNPEPPARSKARAVRVFDWYRKEQAALSAS